VISPVWKTAEIRFFAVYDQFTARTFSGQG